MRFAAPQHLPAVALAQEPRRLERTGAHPPAPSLPISDAPSVHDIFSFRAAVITVHCHRQAPDEICDATRTRVG
jgi:hypothetical protein